MENLLEHIEKEARGGVCPLNESIAFLDVIDNWVYDRALNKVFMNLPIGSHEWFLSHLEIWHGLSPEEKALGWIDNLVGSDTWAKLADQWLQNGRGFYLSSRADTLWPKKLTTIERRLLKNLNCAEGL